jgi:hypothetical protein
MKVFNEARKGLIPLLAAACFSSCGTGDGIPRSVLDAEYVVFAWNDLGMHCLNPTYDAAVLLPPYNTLWAQVVRRGDPPAVVTDGLTVEYRVVDNTYSYGKTDSLGGIFAGFWDRVEDIFGVAGLEHDTGLNLDDPSRHNGLSGEMVAEGDHFQAIGIPVVPVDDSGTWNPYQVVEITVRDASANVVGRTRTTIPTSDEIDCARCHGSDPLADVLVRHDSLHATTLVADAPVLCASCHGSPALGAMEPGTAGTYLSAAIHGAHAERGASCYDCHPGETTRCSRSVKHTADDGNCTECHGSMADVSSSIASGDRVPWAVEPKCTDCHDAGIAGVDTGGTLYRNAADHGGLYCAACHGSPHAMLPTTQPSDGLTAQSYQGAAISIGSCGACHDGSRGPGGLGEYGSAHGGSSPEVHNACFICHSSVDVITGSWPHAFGWSSH